MFDDSYNLENIDLSSFNTANVTDMSCMFYFITNKLKSLDLSSFNTANVTDMSGMFYYCSRLQTIYAGSDWNTSAVTSSNSMFGYCGQLVGGMGTTYSRDHIDAEYARLDGGSSNPGYFTAIPMAGDVNGDGQISVTDATMIIAALLTDDMSGIIEAQADFNGDGAVNITTRPSW